jgi:peptidoglycan/LPS O-acetylase OafA/YrhL
MNENTDRLRLTELDCLRGIAAVSVMLFHFISNNIVFHYGNMGVTLFFMISGFVIFMTLESTQHPLDFLVARFSRLFPTYWICIFVTIIITSLLLGSEHYGLKQVLFNLTMFQSFFNIKSVDGAYWTLAVELVFYIIMFIIFFTKKIKSIEIIAISWLLIILALQFLKITELINPVIYKISAQLSILRFAPLFISGIVFYLIKMRGISYFRILLILLALGIQITLIQHNFVERILTISFFAIFFLLVFNFLSFINTRFLIFLGNISYPLYLVHENVGIGIIRLLVKITSNQFIINLVPIIVVISVAFLIHIYVEKPAAHRIRSEYKNLKLKIIS